MVKKYECHSVTGLFFDRAIETFEVLKPRKTMKGDVAYRLLVVRKIDPITTVVNTPVTEKEKVNEKVNEKESLTAAKILISESMPYQTIIASIVLQPLPKLVPINKPLPCVKPVKPKIRIKSKPRLIIKNKSRSISFGRKHKRSSRCISI